MPDNLIAMSSLPTWAVAVLAAGAPVLAFAGALFGNLVSRSAAKDLDKWRRREETMRMLRWAVEKAVDREERIAEVGIATLSAMWDSELLQSEDSGLLAAVTDAVLGDTLDEVTALGADADVVEE